jgi:hypothetical protein
MQEDGFYDKTLIFKLATGQPGNYQRLSAEELVKIQSYLHKISFAGTQSKVISRKGDVLLPRVTVYHDGAVSENEIYSNIENCLNDFVHNMPFDQGVYVSKVIDAIQKADHVIDVHFDPSNSDHEGIFIVSYDDDDNIIPVEVNDSGEVISYEQYVSRMFVPGSGYIRQSTKAGSESNIPTWRECITLLVENNEI